MAPQGEIKYLLRKAALVEMSEPVDEEKTLDTTTVKPILPTLAKLYGGRYSLDRRIGREF